jgi:hypothetical protein
MGGIYCGGGGGSIGGGDMGIGMGIGMGSSASLPAPVAPIVGATTATGGSPSLFRVVADSSSKA